MAVEDGLSLVVHIYESYGLPKFQNNPTIKILLQTLIPIKDHVKQCEIKASADETKHQEHHKRRYEVQRQEIGFFIGTSPISPNWNEVVRYHVYVQQLQHINSETIQ